MALLKSAPGFVTALLLLLLSARQDIIFHIRKKSPESTIMEF